MMDKDDYLMTQEKLIILGNLMEGMPLDEFLQAIDRVETVGPIVDPTLWMKGHRNMDKIKRIATAARAFQKECAAVKEETLEEVRHQAEYEAKMERATQESVEREVDDEPT